MNELNEPLRKITFWMLDEVVPKLWSAAARLQQLAEPRDSQTESSAEVEEEDTLRSGVRDVAKALADLSKEMRQFMGDVGAYELGAP